MTQPKRNPLLSPFSQPRRLDAVARSDPATFATYYAPPRRTATAPQAETLDHLDEGGHRAR